MNNIHQQQNMNSWHAMYSVTDRQKVVQILSSTLKDIQGASFDAERATAMAQEYEKFTFVKSQSRDEYLRQIKQKVSQLRTGQRNPAMGMLPNMNMGNINQPKQPQAQQQQNQQNGMNQQNMNFMQQQVQARQQAAVQMQAQMRNNGISNQQPSGPQMAASQQMMQSNPQQVQQISNMIRNVPIPQTLLSKIPNLPLNVNTWAQIFDCFQKKIIPANVMPLVKDIHNTHIQLAYRQHQQQKLNQMQRMNQGQNQINPNSQTAQRGNMNVNGAIAGTNTTPVMNNMAAFNMKALSPQQKQQLLQRQMQSRNGIPGQQAIMTQNQNQSQNQNQNQHQQSSPSLQQRQVQQQAHPPQQQPQQQQQQFGNSQIKPPNFQITPQDIMKYSSDALALLSRLQATGSIQGNLDQSQKENFIRKYIVHQKTQSWRQQNPNRGNDMGDSGNIMAGNGMQMPRGMHGQIPQKHTPVPQSKPNQTSPLLKNMGINGQQVMNNQQVPNISPMMQQRAPPNQIPLSNNGNGNGNNKNGMNYMGQQGRSGTNVPPGIASLLPPLTDEMKMKLWQMIEEVSRNNIALKDVTMMLSPQDKNTVRETMSRISQQYANVDSIITYFFIITRNNEGTKRLIQMKYMTKNIMESLQRGVYLASPDLLEKLRSQYQKYFDYVKEQFAGRRQQMQNQQPNVPQQTQHIPQSQQLNQQQIPMAQGQPQYMNNQARNGPVQSMMSQAPQRTPSQMQSMNLNQNTPWPGAVNSNQPSRPATNSSPWMPQASPPMQAGQTPAPMPQKQIPKTTNNQNKKTSNAPTPSASRKKANKGTSSVGGIPTPAGNTSTPSSMANAIKTPNSIPTPQIGQIQSNKNTPTGNSPSSSKNASAYAQNSVDVFIHSETDSRSSKRRELSKSNPEKFFFASMANLLELDDSSLESIRSRSPGVLSKISKDQHFVKSPLSPASMSSEWSCEIKPFAIVSSFRQVDTIKDFSTMDVIKACAETIFEETKQQGNGIKRERDDEENLSEEKKLKVDKKDFRCMYEPVDFDTWKDFIVADGK